MTSRPSGKLEACGLTRSYSLGRRWPVAGGLRLTALDRVDLTIPARSAVGIVGESGCGKSTLARLLAGLDRPTSGDVRLDGVSLSDMPRKSLALLRRRLQMVYQEPRGTLDPRWRVQDQVAEPLSVHGLADPVTAKDRAAALLRAMGLPREALARYPHELSGGQCQRVVLARAMICDPSVLICDEPTSSLDVSAQAQVVNLLQQLRAERSLTLVFVSHSLGLVRHLCELTAVMYLGKVVEFASREAIFDRPEHPYTRALIDAVPVADPRRRRTRSQVVGEPPNPAAPPTGCAFHPRCPMARPVCRREEPTLKALSAEHSVACHAAPQENRAL